MHHHEDRHPINLTLMYSGRPTGTSTPSVYAGKMDWSESMVSAANEMFLVVIPESPISRSAHFGSGTRRATRIPLAKKVSITHTRGRRDRAETCSSSSRDIKGRTTTQRIPPTRRTTPQVHSGHEERGGRRRPRADTTRPRLGHLQPQDSSQMRSTSRHGDLGRPATFNA